MLTRAAGYLALSALAALAGCKPVTEILLVVRSDVPDELKSVHVFVASSGTLPMGGTPYEALDVQDPGCQCLSDTGCPAVPFSLGMLPDDPDNLPDHPFELAVDGYARRGCSEDVFIEAKARVKFVHEKTLALYLDLLSACEGVICPPHFTCDPALRTCKDDTVPPDQLSPVDPGSFSIAELGPQADLSKSDFAGVDIAEPPDQSGLRDFTVLPDLALPDFAGVDLTGVDLSQPPPQDLSMLPDLSMPPGDMSMSPGDMSMSPGDMSMSPGDMSTPGDMAQGPMFDQGGGEMPPPIDGGGTDMACFVAGTPVWTPTGPQPIEQVQLGDRLLALDAQRAVCDAAPALGRVARRSERRVGEVIDLEIGGETITATPEHPFFVLGQGFTAASLLRPGDPIATADGSAAAVDRTAWRRGDFTVYNFDVDALHTYYVGERRLLVHNGLCTQMMTH